MSNKPTKDRHTNHKELYLDSQDSNSPSSPYNNDQGQSENEHQSNIKIDVKEKTMVKSKNIDWSLFQFDDSLAKDLNIKCSQVKTKQTKIQSEGTKYKRKVNGYLESEQLCQQTLKKDDKDKSKTTKLSETLMLANNNSQSKQQRQKQLESEFFTPFTKSKLSPTKQQEYIDLKRISGQEKIILEDCPIYFPFEPYPVQVDYMKCVLRTLNRNHMPKCVNALLESPTGTGKTLCLLSSVLSWAENNLRKTGNSVKIIYLSRTHSQLKQVQREMQKTCFRPTMTVIGSRDQLCINQTFLKQFQLSGTNLIDACNRGIHNKRIFESGKKTGSGQDLEKFKKQTCFFSVSKDKIEGIASDLKHKIIDLEELKQLGTVHKFCPYFYPMAVRLHCSMFFMPYNYILDIDLLENYKNILTGNIIIFDEAHNLPDAACQGQSCDFTNKVLMAALAQMIRLSSSKINQDELDDEYHNVSQATNTYLRSSLNQIKQNIVFYFQSIKDKKKQTSYDYNKKQNKVMMSKDETELALYQLFFGVLNQQQTTSFLSKTQNYQQKLGRLIQFCNSVTQKGHQVLTHSSHDRPKQNFSKVVRFFTNLSILLKDLRLNKGDVMTKIEHYRVYLKWSFSENEPAIINSFQIQLTCLQPFLVFSSILECKPRNIILTSGTLSPLESWQKELNLEFTQAFKGAHVIQTRQISLNIVNKGVLDEPFEFSFQKMKGKKMEHMNQLALTIIQICKQVPHGILAIFPSKSFIKEFKQQIYSIQDHIISLKQCKSVIFEEDSSQQYIKKFREEAVTYRGAILFCVCRGKASEGIDFPDEACRAVIFVGVPYPNINDLIIKQKRAHYDYMSSVPKSTHIKGSQWYQQGTVRAVNQGLGRVIRNRTDYGMIFMLDKRYSYRDNLKNFPEWTIKSQKIIDDCGKPFFKSIRSFYQANRMQFERRKHIRLRSELDNEFEEQERRQALMKTNNKNALDLLMKNRSGKRENSIDFDNN